MKKLLIAVMLVLGCKAAFATAVRYTYVGNNYDYLKTNISDHYYDLTMHVEGWFTTDAPLPNLTWSEISDYITAFAFSYGVHTITETSSLDLSNFVVVTDDFGKHPELGA